MWLSLLVLFVLVLLYRWYRQSQILENLTDKYVFITGCDSGFGNVLAKQLDKRGMKVLASCLTEKGADDLKKETSSRLQTVILDVADSQSVSSAAKWIANIVGNHGLWGLVNNAGFVFTFGPNAWQTRADFEKVLNINLVGLFDVTVNLLPLIIKARGRIVNVSSCGGRLPVVGGGYCPSKFGVEALSDSLRRELRDFGVKVSIIEPGAFRTGMGRAEPHLKNLEHMWLNLSTQMKAYFGEQYYYQSNKTLELCKIDLAVSRIPSNTDVEEITTVRSLETEGLNCLLIMWLLLMAVFGLVLLYRWYRQSLILENLTDKYVFITGCDSGFGNLLAKQLDKCGMKVLAACLTDHGAENLKKETSSRLQTVILDVTNSESVSAAAEFVSTTVGNAGLWGLVNNAGAFLPAPNEWQKKEDFVRVVNVNLIGTVDVTLHLLPLVRKAQGRIVNVSSCLGRLAFIGGGYCMSKSGVQAFSDGLRRELYEFGVKVSIIEPGCFGTMMTLSINHVKNLKRLWENLPQGIKDSYGEQYYEEYEKGLNSLVGTASPKIYEVTNCMEHALTAVYPWTRYSPGLDGKLFYLPMSYLPTVLSDYVLCRSTPKPAAKK